MRHLSQTPDSRPGEEGVSNHAHATVETALRALAQAPPDDRLSRAEDLAVLLTIAAGQVETGLHLASAPLIDALRDENWVVRWGAAHALGRARATAAGPAIRPLLEDPQPRVARTAAWSLGRIRDAGAVPALAAAVRSPNARLSAAAAWALGRCGTPEARAALMDALESASSRALRSITIALKEMGPEASETLVDLLQTGSVTTRTRAAAILNRSGEAAAPLLLPLLQSTEIKHRRAAAHILGTLKLSAALGEQAGEALAAVLRDEDPRVRRSAARSLGCLGYRPARETVEWLLAGQSEDVRVAAHALAALGDSLAGPALEAALLREDLAPEAENALRRALQRLGLAPAHPRRPVPAPQPDAIPTRRHYLAEVTSGLEMVAWEEMTARMPGSSLLSFGDGRVVFLWDGSPQAGAVLRSVKQLFQGGRIPAEIPLARRLRRYRLHTLPASVEPTTAYLMARLANTGDRDVFVDLTCGTATIAIERALDGPARLILAGDISADALGKAADNVAAGSQPVRLVQWDARNLPLAARSVSSVAANLPYGHRAGAHSGNLTMYPALLAEVDRVLRPGGIAVLLTTEKRLVRKFLEDHPAVKLASEQEIDAGGLRPTLFVLQKK